MHENPYRSPADAPTATTRGVGWWLLALAAGGAIGLAFGTVAVPL